MQTTWITSAASFRHIDTWRASASRMSLLARAENPGITSGRAAASRLPAAASCLVLRIHIEKINDNELEVQEKHKLELEHCNSEKLYEVVTHAIYETYQLREDKVVGLGIDPSAMRHQEKLIMLQVLDTLWKDHLLGMDHLKEGIGLRGYAQKNPLTEYKKEGFSLFSNLMSFLILFG